MRASALIAALVLSVKNAAATTVTAAPVTAVMLSVTDMVAIVGPRGVAVAFAVLGAGWRWFKFRLPLRDGVSGILLSMTLAFMLGDGQVPLIGPAIAAINVDSVPMMNGFFMGLFGLLLVTGAQDFIRSYIAAKKDSK